MTPSANVAASIRQRLLNRARADKRLFNELLQYYAMERFLYRCAFFASALIGLVRETSQYLALQNQHLPSTSLSFPY